MTLTDRVLKARGCPFAWTSHPPFCRTSGSSFRLSALSLWSWHLSPLYCRTLGGRCVLLQNAPDSQWLRGQRRHAGLSSLGAASSEGRTRLAQHPPEPPGASGLPSAPTSPLSPANPTFLFYRTKARCGPITVGLGQNSVKGCLGASGQRQSHLETCVTFLPGSGQRSAPVEVARERAISLHLHPPGACRISL